MGDRVRRAMALDDVEDLVIKQCGENVEKTIRTTKHHQAILKYHIIGAVEDAADKHGVEFDWLWKESLSLLRTELFEAVGGLREHERIEPYIEDGRTVGIKISFYMIDRKR